MNTNIDRIYNQITEEIEKRLDAGEIEIEQAQLMWGQLGEIETILYAAADTLDLEIEPIIL